MVGEILLSQIGWLLLVTGIAFSVLQCTSRVNPTSPISRDLALISQISPFILLTFCFVTDAKSLLSDIMGEIDVHMSGADQFDDITIATTIL